MTCALCKNGQTQKGLTTRAMERDRVIVVVRHVPAETCDNCGQVYYDADTTARLLSMLDEAERQGAETTIRTYAAV